MNMRHAVMVGLMGRHADRFHEYHAAKTLAERLDAVHQVPGADGIEVVYPQDFGESLEQTSREIRASGLPVSAINLNVKTEKIWQVGSFTSPDPAVRAQAVTNLRIAMDLAAEFDAWMVTCCPLIDGHNYSFQVDYLQQWGWLEACIAEAAAHRGDVRISLEYKLNESRNYCVLGDMGRSLYLCEHLGLPNVGVTMDVGHALIAKETPAEALALAHRAGRLFYVHLNDNGREWDWDMIPGSVNFWDLIEMLYYMDRIGWDGWVSYDVNSRQSRPIETMSATIAAVKTAEQLLDRIGRDRIAGFIAEGNPAPAFTHLFRSLL